MFTTNFNKYACVGDSIECEIDGVEYTARIEHDIDPTPFDDDCHGKVTERTRRVKGAGERVACVDRGGFHFRYYDWQGTMERAKREGWSAEPHDKGTRGERAARAVERDYQAIRGWFADEWFYCGIVIGASKEGVEIDDHCASLWGGVSNVITPIRTIATSLTWLTSCWAKQSSMHKGKWSELLRRFDRRAFRTFFIFTIKDLRQ